MIQANELRIGNWVNLTKDGVAFITKVEPTILMMLTNEIDSNGIKVNPIPLTEEMLIKCGFDLDSAPYHAFLLKTVLIYYNGNWHFERTHTIIKYLHQLQNLYFALTGQELEINL